MKAKVEALWSMRTTVGGEEKKIGELVEVYFGKPLKMIGYAVIENDDQSNAQYFDDYEDAVDKCVHRFKVVRDDVYRSAYFARVCRKPESDDEEIQGFYNLLSEEGFNIDHTGGGCTAWRLDLNEGTPDHFYIMVGMDGNADILRAHLDDCGISVGLYRDHDGEMCDDGGEYFIATEVSCAVAQLQLIMRLIGSQVFTIKKEAMTHG